ncbi:polyphosphate kinase 2 family protein [Gloeocapsopsis dulcis]|uniref:Polyphosphate kinase n=1 Tax=Gloeocapsopsis dulcis AAB1 = 1H9 TaxID=1433147 RepID=A0A6N8FZI0_9CHRO|nr:polyphosphate kinase 2 family protein [Gloeocapsopsis dulcis]MUL38570.1 polyphosphate kinase [Gloeocapsopsis dulcis AAB1 = 1H9]WNN91131.1 polyphosphate kinase 2 family protein [Gloeocapsopsis dulcis]
MNQDSDRTNNLTSTDVAEAEERETTQAAERKANSVADVVSPETLVVNEPPPKPDYPRYRVSPDERIRLTDISPDTCEHYKKKKYVEQELEIQRKRLAVLQERLYAENERSVLIVLQAMDTGGKDGTIKHVFRGINPQGCQVWSFKKPTDEELSHDFLWRYHRRAPRRGMITIFNRSHYEDVLIVRVKDLVSEEVWRQHYRVINEFEHMLTLDNIVVVKFFLHISRDEQRRRLESRLEDPDKRWKFSINDVNERKLWDDYQQAYEDAINNCSTAYAPWYVVPSNKKWYRNLVIARAIADTLEAMNPQYPAAAEGLKNIVIPR